METNGASNVGIQQKSLPNSTIVLILGIPLTELILYIIE